MFFTMWQSISSNALTFGPYVVPWLISTLISLIHSSLINLFPTVTIGDWNLLHRTKQYLTDHHMSYWNRRAKTYPVELVKSFHTTKDFDVKFEINHGSLLIVHHYTIILVFYGNIPRGNENVETLMLTAIGSRKAIDSLIEEALRAKSDTSYQQVYNAVDGFWMGDTSVPKRDIGSVFVEGKSRAMEDLDDFLKPETAARYQKSHIRYHRGMLLSGPPGTGKTSLILALAAHRSLSIARCSLGRTSAQDLEKLQRHMPRRSVLVLEDIDTCFSNREYTGSHEQPPTLDDIFQLLDGTLREGIYTFITTNYPERLDEALIRPGRVGLHIVFDLLSSEYIVQLLKSRLDCSEEWAQKIAEMLGDKQWAASTLEELILAARFKCETVESAVLTWKNKKGNYDIGELLSCVVSLSPDKIE